MVFKDGFAGWTFEISDYSLRSKRNFANLSTESQLEFFRQSLDVANGISERLSDFNLFNLKKYNLNGNEVLIEDMDMYLDSENPEAIEGFVLTGDVGFYQRGQLKWISHEMEIEVEVKLGLVSVMLLTDKWMPIGYDYKINGFNDARINSNRLETCLLSMENIGFRLPYNYNEVTQEYVCTQFEFKMYYAESFGRDIEGKYQKWIRSFQF
ncbi:hypothetical protein [Neolewinella antarctica]|uniref:Uncharacterized protein n=1 Tax=Neolewinella antarctica TaxID=442734 RepID=A0ABX0XEF8_9BACT|nr:hypothetical protein [Neolewinella antarctica]NJC27699.1 hypothetical protein [Neolewinella antarctica]